MPSRLVSWVTVSVFLGMVPGLRAQAPALQEIPEFGVGTELVRIDVVVTDEDGRLVSSLERDDFVVLEDDEPQEIVHFEAYSRGVPRLEAVQEEQGRPITEYGEEVEGFRRRHVVFAVDDFHIQPGNLSLAKKAMLRFIEEDVGPEDRVALVATSGSLGLYQAFTNDETVLRRAISRVTPQPINTRWIGPPQISEYQAELIERGDPQALEMAIQEILLEQPLGASRDDAEIAARTRARAVRAETSHFVRTTLQTLDSVMRSLAELPGRKVIVLVSDGFLMGLGTANHQVFDLRRITDAGTRAGVVVYGLDTRGLVAPSPIGGADKRGSPSVTSPGVRESISQQESESVRDGMTSLARDTGGFLVYGTNDLSRALYRIMQDTQTYYLLAYQPTNMRLDGRFREIKIRLPGREDLDIRARRGYYAADERKARREVPEPEPDPAGAGQQAAEDLRRALASLYPQAGLPTRLAVDFVKMDGAGPQVVVNGHVDLAALDFEEVGERHDAAVVVAGVVYDADGQPLINLEPQRAGLSLEPVDYEQARKAGLKYQKTLSLGPGSYEVRLAVREEGTGRLGSASRWIDVPDLNLGRLTLSDVFLLKGAAPPSGEESGDSLRDVQALPRFGRSDSLFYQVQVLNAKEDDSGETHLTLQAHIFERDQLLASTRERPVRLSQLGAVSQAYTGRITLRPLHPGDYNLQVAVTDHLGQSTVLKRVAFTVEP